MRIRPTVFVWNGQHMVPLPRFRQQCNQQYVVGEEYPLTMLEARSRQSHNHYFASVHEAWVNLPESIAVDFPSEEHLRKWALIQCGYCSETTLPCETGDHANHLAVMARRADAYSIVVVRGNVVKIFSAASQSAAAMGREEFQKSKVAVLEKIAALLDTKPRELERAGDQHFKREPKRNPSR